MISYTITACNEDRELDKLLNVIRVNLKDIDEVVVQLDQIKQLMKLERCVRYIKKEYHY